MGLDMSLFRKTYIPAPAGEDATVDIHIEHKTWLGKEYKKDFHHVEYIVEDVGYWRKANQIHNWFVEKCGDGIDECQVIPVTRENLEELLEICKKILKRGKCWKQYASTFLPTRAGFFFGSTDYDEWYFEDIKNTVEILEKVLAVPEDDYTSYYYQASW